MQKGSEKTPVVQQPNPQGGMQQAETAAYVPSYKVKPEFKQAVLQAIGDRPFNEIAGLINAIAVDTLDHQTLVQIINAIGQFPYVKVEKLLSSINDYVTQTIPED